MFDRAKAFVSCGAVAVRAGSALTAVLVGLLNFSDKAVAQVAAIGTAAYNPIVANIAGPDETVFRWSTDRCENWTVPDAPARAFVDEYRKIHLFASSSSNWSLVGASFDDLQVNCAPAFVGAGLPNSSQFDDRGWIESLFTADGKSVYALISNEWRPSLRAGAGVRSSENPCGSRQGSDCLYYSINVAQSVDGGFVFAYPSNSHVVASVPLSDLSSQHSVGGFATASNMLESNGYVYAFLGVRRPSKQDSGSCLYRSRKPGSAADWSYWDGKKFSQPYSQQQQTALPVQCHPVNLSFVDPVELRSVSHFGLCSCYVGVFEGHRKVEINKLEAGFYVVTSTDLINWSGANLLMATPKMRECHELLVYPSLIDPNSTSRNFGEITARPYLYFTRFNRSSCNGTANRDLVRRAVQIVRVDSGNGASRSPH